MTVEGAGAGDRYSYRIDGGPHRPDPASQVPARRRARAVAGHRSRGLPLDRRPSGAAAARATSSIYELHVGTFTPEGTFAGAATRLPRPRGSRRHRDRADAGRRLPGRAQLGLRRRRLFAPSRAYGRPDDLRRLVDAAHRARPRGHPRRRLQPPRTGRATTCPQFCPGYFTDRHQTPWGDAINLDGEGSRRSARFVIDNALLLDPRVPPRRPAARRHARDHRRQRRATSLARDRARGRAAPPTGRVVVYRRRPSQPRDADRSRRRRAAGASTASGPTTSTTSLRRLLAGDDAGYYADYAGIDRRAAATLRAGLAVHRASTRAHHDDAARHRPVARADAALRRLPAEPRSGRQPRHRRSAAPPIDPAAWRAASAAALTSPMTPLLFMGQEWAASHAVPVLHRSRAASSGRWSPRAGAASSRTSRSSRAPARAERDSRSAGRGDVRAQPPGLGRARRRRTPHSLALYRDLLHCRTTHPALGGSDETLGGRDAHSTTAPSSCVARPTARGSLIVVRLAGAGTVSIAAMSRPHRAGIRAHDRGCRATRQIQLPIGDRRSSGREVSVAFGRPGAVILNAGTSAHAFRRTHESPRTPEVRAGQHLPPPGARRISADAPLATSCPTWHGSGSARSTPRRTSPRRRAARTATTSATTTRSTRSSAAPRRTRPSSPRSPPHGMRPHRRLRAEPHGHRHRRERVVERRARERPELAVGEVLRRRLGAGQGGAARQAAAADPRRPVRHVLERGELQLVFKDGALVLHYFDHELPINPRQAPRVYAAAVEPLHRRARRRQPAAARVPEHHRLAAEPAALHRIESGTHRRAAAREGSGARRGWRGWSPRRRRSARPSKRRSACSTARRATPRASTRCTSCSRRSPTGSPTGAPRRTRSITAASSTSTRSPACASRTRTSSPRPTSCSEQLTRDGKVQAVRIDHPDGLFDPARYFSMLQELAARGLEHAARVGRRGGRPDRPLYVVAEKILSGARAAAGRAGRSTARPATTTSTISTASSSTPRRRGGCAASTPSSPARPSRSTTSSTRAKRLIMSTAMASELNVLAHMLDRIGEGNRKSRDFTLDSLRDVITEVVACFPVYRTYVDEHGWRPADRAVVSARNRARTQAQSGDGIVAVRFLPRGRPAARSERRAPPPRGNERRDGYPPVDEAEARERLRFAMKFQQYTGTGSGEGPRRHGVLPLQRAALAQRSRRRPVALRPHRSRSSTTPMPRGAATWPFEMLATATHDTKIGEDVRARINVLSEFPDEWSRQVARWMRINKAYRTHRRRRAGTGPG